MGGREKRRRKVLGNPKTVDFNTLDLLLKDYGFECKQPRRGSSHQIYQHPETKALISVPYKRPHVKECYVREVIKLLELEREEDA